MNGGDLKQWRKNSGLTQAKAAKYLFIPLTTYQNYEQGHRTIPDAVAARTQYTPSGAPRDAKPRHERRPYPNEDLRQYMLPEADDSKAKTMDRYVEAWGGWFTIQYHTVGGWHPTLYRGNCETVYAEPRPGEHKDPQMPLHMLPHIYNVESLEAALPLAGADNWRKAYEYYAAYNARILREMRDLQAAGTW